MSAPLKTSLRQLEERAGAMREAKSARRQAVLFITAHLAEGAIKAIRQKHRIVSKTRVTARRPHQRAVNARLEFLDMAIGPGDAKGGNEMRLAPIRLHRPVLAQFVLDRLHCVREILARSGP